MYKGGTGQWAYYLHRITGLGIFAYLLIHVVDTALIGWGPKYFNAMMALYRNPFFKLGEIALFATVLFHSLNGIRIVIFDFWVGAGKYHRALFWLVIILFFAVFIPVSLKMLHHVHF